MPCPSHHLFVYELQHVSQHPIIHGYSGPQQLPCSEMKARKRVEYHLHIGNTKLQFSNWPLHGSVLNNMGNKVDSCEDLIGKRSCPSQPSSEIYLQELKSVIFFITIVLPPSILFVLSASGTKMSWTSLVCTYYTFSSKLLWVNAWFFHP